MPILGSRAVWQGNDRLSPNVKRVMAMAERNAALLGKCTVDTDVFLVTMIDDDPEVISRLIGDEARMKALNQSVCEKMSSSRAIVGCPPLGDEAREAVILAVNEARRCRTDQVDLPHLFVGSLMAKGKFGSVLLAEIGLTVEGLQHSARQMGAAQRVKPASEASSMRTVLSLRGPIIECARCESALLEEFSFCYSCGAQVTSY